MFFLDYFIKDSRSFFFSLKAVFGLNFFCITHIFKYLGFSQKKKNFSLITMCLKPCVIYKNFILKSFYIDKELILLYKNFISYKFGIRNFYHGYRLRRGYPVRGQRTHTNARTSRKLLYKKQFNFTDL